MKNAQITLFIVCILVSLLSIALSTYKVLNSTDVFYTKILSLQLLYLLLVIGSGIVYYFNKTNEKDIPYK